MNDKLNISIEKEFSSPSLLELLEVHKAHCEKETPIESCHRLDVGGLRAADLTFWVAWQGAKAVGMIGLKELNDRHGEVKSMHVSENLRGFGLADELFLVMKDEAVRRHYNSLSLETGNSPNFQPAIRFYSKHGFSKSAPFGDYIEDPNSLFMALTMTSPQA